MVFFIYLAESRAITTDRANNKSWLKMGDDEIYNPELEEFAAHALRVDIPKKLKAVIKFGYEDGLKKKLDEEKKDFDSWIQEVFTHTQAHFKHDSLGTEIVFEVSNT